MSTVCGFNQGPAAGTTRDYAPLDPLPVGTACISETISSTPHEKWWAKRDSSPKA